MKLPLTISLLASNRTASLERCLDSLKPLLQKVPAELIIVFTGTEERVRQAAARYTEQIVPFTWCDDFSAARNEGLKRAKGEWFLYLDDDEWFDDVTEICEFFQSGEYKNYNSASYIQRNYLDWNGAQYSDVTACRMARRTENLSFQNPIHEVLLPFDGPCKMFHSYVHHYGYLKETVSKRDGKGERNIPLLLKDIKERPDYTRNYTQLTQEYFVTQRWDEAVETCRQGLKVCGKMETKYQDWLQSYLIESLYKKGDYEQTEKEALLILENESPCELLQLVFYPILIAICEQKGDYVKALKYGEKFEGLLNYMEQHPQLWTEQRLGLVNKDKVMNPDWLYPARLNCVMAALELSDREKAKYFLQLLPWDKEYMIEQYYPLLDQWKETYADLLPELLASLLYDSQYLLMQRLLLEGDPFLFRRCLKEIEHPYLLQQLVKKACQSKSDLSLLLNRMDLDSWKKCIFGVINGTPYTDMRFLWEAQETLFADYLLQGLWFKKLLLEKELTRGFPMKEALLETLEEYAQCVRAFYKEQYQEFMFREDCFYLLPSDCRLSFVILEALDFWRQGQMAETIRSLRTALQIEPRMTGVIREVIRILNYETAHPAPAAGAEFEQLASQMKAALRTMADNKQYSEAEQVLAQLIPLLPDDMELLKLQQRLMAEMKD
ncbi:MAG: glycosyltransferase [Lachnospiraceae bacterium]|nr:glycosyltransferase [Lachnospiraceae bacterium]